MVQCDYIWKGIRYLTNSSYRWYVHTRLGFHKDEDDKTFLKHYFRSAMGYEIDFSNPITFNEKLQWLKIHDRKPEYTMMVDKYAVKEYVTKKIGVEHVVPTIGVWNHFDEIDFDNLPEKFVLKTTHDSGGIVICRDKASFDKRSARKKLEGHLKRNHFYVGREWPYKDVPPRILAERLIETDADALVVYKFFCFNGEPKIVQVIQNDKLPNESIDYFNVNWELLELRQNFPNSIEHLRCPDSFEDMKKYCTILSRGYSFLRIDFYEQNGSPIFSEFTFYSDAGFAKFEPEIWDRKLGELIHLPIESNVKGINT